MKENKDILIIGIGNEFRGDDAVGIEVVNSLQVHHPDLAEYRIEQNDLSRLVDIWGGRDVILIDAVFSEREYAGKIHMLSSIPLLMANRESNYSSHGLALSDALKMSKVLNELPSSLLFLGVEGNDWKFGIRMSEKVRQVIPIVESRILDYVSDQSITKSIE